jgi:hypothetical protein
MQLFEKQQTLLTHHSSCEPKGIVNLAEKMEEFFEEKGEEDERSGGLERTVER